MVEKYTNFYKVIFCRKNMNHSILKKAEKWGVPLYALCVFYAVNLVFNTGQVFYTLLSNEYQFLFNQEKKVKESIEKIEFLNLHKERFLPEERDFADRKLEKLASELTDLEEQFEPYIKRVKHNLNQAITVIDWGFPSDTN